MTYVNAFPSGFSVSSYLLMYGLALFIMSDVNSILEYSRESLTSGVLLTIILGALAFLLIVWSLCYS